MSHQCLVGTGVPVLKMTASARAFARNAARAYMVMAYTVMAYIVMAYTVMAYVVMAYIVLA